MNGSDVDGTNSFWGCTITSSEGVCPDSIARLCIFHRALTSPYHIIHCVSHTYLLPNQTVAPLVAKVSSTVDVAEMHE